MSYGSAAKCNTTAHDSVVLRYNYNYYDNAISGCDKTMAPFRPTYINRPNLRFEQVDEQDIATTITSTKQYLGPNTTVNFYSLQNELIATIENGDYDYGWTTLEIDRAGNGVTQFWSTEASMANKSFKITPTNNTPAEGQTYDLTIYYTKSEIDGLLAATSLTTAHMEVVKITDYAISDVSVSDSLSSSITRYTVPFNNYNIDDYKITLTGLSGFSGFGVGYLGSSNTLPVEMLTFKGKMKDETVLLNWQTASETNNEGFEVQRSYNDVEYEKISWVEGSGNSNKLIEYSYIDADYAQNVNTIYYRLKQIDFDGETKLSKTISVNTKSKTNASVYNYDDDIIVNTGEAYSHELFMEIYSIDGKLIETRKLPANIKFHKIDVNLTKSIYFVRIYGDQ